MTYYGHSQVLNCISGYHSKRCICFIAQKTHQVSYTVQCCSAVFPVLLKHSVCSSCPFTVTPLQNTQSPLIGQLTHAWPSIANNRIAVLHQSLCARLATMHTFCTSVTWWCSVMSQSCNYWWGISGEGASVSADFDLFDSKDCLQIREHV